jgi:hypothetical protein
VKRIESDFATFRKKVVGKGEQPPRSRKRKEDWRGRNLFLTKAPEKRKSLSESKRHLTTRVVSEPSGALVGKKVG